jgi:hypothetical protein
MRLDIETEIRYRSGERAGIIREVLLDENNEVSDVIMSIGGIIIREVAVPVSALSEGEGGVLYIDLDPDQVDKLPPYTEELMPAVTGEWEFTPQPSAIGEVFPATMYEPIIPVMEVPSVDEGAIIITQGTEVRCLDGRWGIVDEVVVDDQGRTQAFVGRPDDIYQPDRLIPLELVQETGQEAILLNCNAADLPTYTQALINEPEEPEPA